MEDNIFKTLRLSRTEETVMRGKGKSIEVKRPFSGTRLAKELNISQATLDNAENGKGCSLSTVEAYHKYFGVPYSVLLGEVDIEAKHNLNINLELGLSDKAISSIKGMSPMGLSMLNAFLGKEEDTVLFFENLAEMTFSLTECLKTNNNNKNGREYNELRKIVEKMIMDYMKNITFKDLRRVLLQMEKQQALIDNLNAEDIYRE